MDDMEVIDVDSSDAEDNRSNSSHHEESENEDNVSEAPTTEPEDDQDQNIDSSDDDDHWGTGYDYDYEETSTSSDPYSDSDYESEKFAEKQKKKKVQRSKIQLEHKEWCEVCQDGGDLLLCSYCIEVYHLECLDPPLAEVPEGEWECPKCALTELPTIDKILFWTWAGDGRGNKKREFFVHFRDKSYWECIWVTEFYLRVYQPGKLDAYWKKWDNQVPPTIQDLEWMGGASLDESDPLTQQYCRYGVKPEWLQPQRVIAEKKCQGEHLYYVKWRDLPYDCCSWEEVKAGVKRIRGFKGEVAKYRAFRKAKELSQSSDIGGVQVFIPPKIPHIDPKIHYKTQPDYLGVQGKNLQLHPYQLEGLNWLRHSWSQKVNTILGDEMGLGKTIQAIAFLYSLWKEGHNKGPFLVTAPLSTVLNWEREFEAWAPDFYVVTFTGLQESRKILRQFELTHEECRATTQSTRVRGPVKFHVLLTSYENISMEAACLSSINWQVMVVDEAHRLRNDSNLFFRTLTNYSVRYKLLLTGTPLQNRLDELFFLLNFLDRAQFKDLETFLCEFEDVSKEDQVKKLHEKLQHHMLRRFKADVFKEMPGKAEIIVRVEMTPFQKKYYKYILTKKFDMLKANFKSAERLQSLFIQLIKCCNHPYLFAAAIEEHDRMYDNDEDRKREALVEASGKLLLLRRILKMLKAEGRRVLIFSQMTKVLDILEDFLEMEGYEYERLDGNIRGDIRQTSIDRFNAPGARQFVFLLSTRAGGLGINLASADTVIIYDSDWNPHNDVQALSRAHRIGQKNKVMIYRFVTHNTAEEKVIETAKQKMMLNTLIVRKFFTKEEMNNIISFGTKKLFEDKSNENAEIHYTDEKLKQLLDRSVVQDTKDSSEQAGFNDYLNSFKLANYAVLEGSEEHNPDGSDALQETSSDYWKRLQEQQTNDENSTRSDSDIREIGHQENQKEVSETRKKRKYAPNVMSKADAEVVHGKRSCQASQAAALTHTVPFSPLQTHARKNRNALKVEKVKTKQSEVTEAGGSSSKKESPNTPEALKKAVADVVNNKFSRKEAASIHGVPYSTLGDIVRKQMNPSNVKNLKSEQPEVTDVDESSSKKRKKWTYTPDVMKKAVEDVVSGKYLCQEAALIHGVPFGTLYSNARKQKKDSTMKKVELKQPEISKKGGSSSKTEKKLTYTPDVMKEAVKDVVSGKYLCQEAALIHGVPFGTLYTYARKQKKTSKLEKAKAKQLQVTDFFRKKENN